MSGWDTRHTTDGQLKLQQELQELLSMFCYFLQQKNIKPRLLCPRKFKLTLCEEENDLIFTCSVQNYMGVISKERFWVEHHFKDKVHQKVVQKDDTKTHILFMPECKTGLTKGRRIVFEYSVLCYNDDFR